MQSCYPGYMNPIGLLNMPLVHHKNESSYVLRLAALIEHVGKGRGLMGLDACGVDQPYDRYQSIRDAEDCS